MLRRLARVSSLVSLASGASCAALAIATTASAQHVNVDFGNSAGVPPWTVGAELYGAGCAPGHWNEVVSFPANNLTDYQGNGTTISLAINAAYSFESDVESWSPTGVVAPLYNDYLIVDGPKQITISGLDTTKTYQVFAYVWDPDKNFTHVKLQGATNFLDIGGDFPHAFLHQRHITYWARNNFISNQSSFTVDVEQYDGMTDGALNGLQIREIEPLGTNYAHCYTGPHPLVNVTLSAYGSQDGSGAAQMSKKDVFLRLEGMPNSQYVYFIMSDTPGSFFSGGVPFCIGTPVHRLPLAWADAGGYARACLNYDTYPGDVVTVGLTYHFQAWYRLPPGYSATNWTSSTTDITFAP